MTDIIWWGKNNNEIFKHKVGGFLYFYFQKIPYMGYSKSPSALIEIKALIFFFF